MTDLELAAKKIAEIETYLGELKSLAEPDKIETDARSRLHENQAGNHPTNCDQ